MLELIGTCIDAAYAFVLHYWPSALFVAAAYFLFQRVPRWVPSRRVAYVAVCALSLATSVLTLHFRGQPQPPRWMGDDYGYLLNADTFLHGRLTNPPHPMRAYFETIYVLQEPTTIAQYLPGNPLVLALGRLIAGRAIVGMIVVTALAAMAMLWALRGWVSEGWAFALACVVAVHPMMAHWSVNFHSGSLSVLGGALMAGAAGRLRHGVAFGVGAVLLLFTRPYEGLFVGVLFGAIFVWHRRFRPLAVAAVIVAAGLAALMADNVVTTGHALRLPYVVYNERVFSIPFFIWQKARPVPCYDVPEIAHVQTMFRNYYFRWRTPRGLLDTAVFESLEVLDDAVPQGVLWLAALVPLAVAPRRLLVSLFIALLSLLQVTTWVQTHYIAPYAALFAVAYACGIVRLPPWLGRASFVALAFLAVVSMTRWWREPFPTGARGAIDAAVTRTPGPHLVIVPPNCDGLIGNGAEIDRQRVVWARDRGANGPLLQYYADRSVWQLGADCTHATLVRPPLRPAPPRQWERDPFVP